MYVCVCNGVTEREIRQAAAAGCSGMTELTMRTGCGAACGSCVSTACALLDDVGREAAGHARDNVLAFERISNAA